MLNISVIIPIHRVASDYLIQCLKSVQSQILVNFEAILILNGSSNTEQKICEEFCDQDKRFNLHQIEKADVSSARNVGIRNAQGKYITFLDSDDWLTINALQILFELMENSSADIGLANTKKIWKSKKEQILFKFNREKECSSIQKIPNFAICGYVFKKQIIQNNQLLYKEGLKLSEDRDFIYNYFTHCKTIAFSNESVYYYRQHSGSICHARQTVNHVIQQFKAASSIAKSLTSAQACSTKHIAHIKRSLARMGITAFFYNSEITSQDKKRIKTEFYNLVSKSSTCFSYCWYRAKISFLIGKLLHL